jgi:N-acetylglucosamine-6-phosphate deacetylase
MINEINKTMDKTREIRALSYITGKPVIITISGERIEKVSETEGSGTYSDLYISPGLFDNQVNGFHGVDFSDLNLTTGMMRLAVESLNATGVTTFFPTVLTNSHDNLLRIFRNLSAALEDDTIRSSVAGFHLEGPYISGEEGFYGCHPSHFIRKPSWDEFMKYQDAASGNIRQVTVGPEAEGCIEFIRKCTASNVIVAIGHTNASAWQIAKAVENGARLSTHLLNGCANMIHRHLNPIWPQMANEDLVPSIIADGHHLIPDEIRVIYKVKGPDRMILTSDVTHLAGLAPGNYVFFGSEIILTEDGLIKNPVLDCLAGASLPLIRGVENVMKFTGCPLEEAVNMASINVAKIYGISDRGSMAPGSRADLILFEKNETELNIKQVWVKGKRLI